MSASETPSERYRRLARKCLETANTLPVGQRDTLIQMAQFWQRLADEYADATVSLSQPDTADQPAMQQQQQVQPDDDKKE
jgi:hypothetical protein